VVNRVGIAAARGLVKCKWKFLLFTRYYVSLVAFGGTVTPIVIT